MKAFKKKETISSLIFAGGTGSRMNSRARPKQFLELHGKPIIIYTLEHFERHPDIDKIIIVCLKNWIDELKIQLVRFGIHKVTIIVPGGDTGHESIYNGLAAMESTHSLNDIVLIHDGVRPLITEDVISQNIESVRKFGSAITAESTHESILYSEDGKLINDVPKRENMYIAKAPQSFRFGMIWDLHQKARRDNILTADSSHLLSFYGMEMHLVKSTPNNMKITGPTDYYIFRALYEITENAQILGS